MGSEVLAELKGNILRLTLNRPEVRNAFNDKLMKSALEHLNHYKENSDVRVVVFKGAGSSFCAGADLQWMKDTLHLSYEETVKDSDILAELFYTLYDYPKPTVALVNGPAIGGGVGFVAACDVAIASENAFFRLSEVRLGLIPAVISYFLIKKVGEGRCRELMLTGKKFTASEALDIGLVNKVVKEEELETALEPYIRHFLEAGPNALKWCKEVITKASSGSPEEIREFTVDIIAKLRTGPEGQEGMTAFLQKRTPSWWPKDLK